MAQADTAATPKLPAAVAAYFDATNKADKHRFLAAFSKDALIDDAGREIRGIDAIEHWADREVFAANVSADVVRVGHNGANVVVTAKIDGTFDKTGLPDPLFLSSEFTVSKDKIAQIVIRLDK